MIKINLGTENGWSLKDRDFARKVMQLMLDDPTCKFESYMVGPCYSKSVYTTECAEVYYHSDSSD